MSENNNTPERDQNDPRQTARFRSPVRTIALTIVCILVVLILINLQALLAPFRILWSILAPITIGLVIAYLCNPFLRFYEYKIFIKIKRRRVNLALSMICAYATILAIIAGILLLVLPQVIGSVNDLLNNGMSYVTKLIDFINRIVSALPLPGKSEEPLVSLEKLLTYLMNWFSNYGTKLLGNLGTLAGSIITVLKNILVGIFVSIYVLLSKDRLNAGCRRVFRALLSPKHEQMLLHYLSTAHKKFGGYLIGKIFDSTMVGIVSGILFSIFHIPYAVMIAVIIGVTDIIPFFGPFIGAIPSALIIFIVSPSKALLFVILIIVVQQIDGNLIAPWILGDRTGLSSLSVLIAVTITGNLMGIVGMVIGVPLFALFMAILDDFISYRLRLKNEKTDLYSYYPADAFIRPEDDNRESNTMTQRFVHWVCAVEEENPSENDTKRHRFSRGFRRLCLVIGRFVYRIFSIHPVPEDESGSIYKRIMKNGMKENRGFWRALGLSLCTLLLYPYYLIEVAAQSTNIACKNDGRRTWGVFPYLLCSVFTLGIFPFVWHCQVINRWQTYCAAHGETCKITKKFFLLWALLGLPTLIGPILALARFLKGMNQMSGIYNREHRTDDGPKPDCSDAPSVPCDTK